MNMSSQTTWQPGHPVTLETRRLIVRTLKTTDIDVHVLRWTEDPGIAGNVWHPPVPPAAYFEGLIAACDQRTRFAFLIQHRRSGRAIGYVKLQVEPERRSQTPTIVLGEREFWNAELGTEAIRAVQRFGFECLPVDQIESRVYAENRKVRERLLRFGYEEADVVSELLPGRAVRKVYVYRIGKERWFTLSPTIEARLAQHADEPGRVARR